MELNSTKDSLAKRKRVGFILISSKRDNYKISFVDISEYETNKIKDDEKCAKFEKYMLKYFSYEIFVNRDIRLFFDFESCKEELGIIINGELPIPYLITVNIVDKDEKAVKKDYYLNIIATIIKNQNNKFFDIILKKVDCPGNDDFIIFQSKDYYNAYYIVHKYEEDWKKFCLYREKIEFK